MALFQHTPLVDAALDIRLLRLKPQRHVDIVECSFSAFKFSQAPSYTAISYTWGNQFVTHMIRMNDAELLVTRNCFNALRQASRHLDISGTYVWIDGVCINQNDRPEKNAQVQMMGVIYKRANLVAISLRLEVSDEPVLLADKVDDAPAGDFRDEWVEWISDVVPRGHAQRYPLLHALHALVDHDYWSRVWIVEELVLANGIEILCNDSVVSWSKISNLVTYMNQAPIWAANRIKELNDLDDGEEILTEDGLRRRFFPMGYSFLRIAEYKLWRENTDAADAARDINVVLSRFQDNQCYDLLDRVYGLMHLIDWIDSAEPPLQVDYAKSPYQVAVECVDYLVATEDIGTDMELMMYSRLVFNALKLSSTAPELEALVQERQSSFHELVLRGQTTTETMAVGHPMQSMPDVIAHGMGATARRQPYFKLSVVSNSCVKLVGLGNFTAANLVWAGEDPPHPFDPIKVDTHHRTLPTKFSKALSRQSTLRQLLPPRFGL